MRQKKAAAVSGNSIPKTGISFTATPISGTSPLLVNFTLSPTLAQDYLLYDAGISALSVQTGDGGTVRIGGPEINSISYQYNAPGSYVATLMAGDGYQEYQMGSPVAITVVGLDKPSFTLPASLKITATITSDGSQINTIADSTGIIADIQCPPVPKGFEGDYGTTTSYTRTFTHNSDQYQALFELYPFTDSSKINLAFTWVYPISGKPAQPGWLPQNVVCLTIASATSTAGISPSVVNELMQLYQSWH